MLYDLCMLESLFKREGQAEPGSLQTFHILTSILALALIAGSFFFFFWTRVETRKDFYNELWAPAYLLVRGQSPYETSSLNPDLPAAWFPMVIGFFSPLGWLDKDAGPLVWFGISLLELCAIIFLSQGKSRSLFITLVAALLALSFPPTLYHLMLGQISLTIMLCMLLAVHLAIKERPWLVGFFVALGLSKPHLVSLAFLGLSFYYYRRGGFKGTVAFWLRTFLMIVILCLPLFMAHPNWIPDAVASMQANPYWDYPSIFVALRLNLGTLGLAIWGAIVLVILYVAYLLWDKLPAQTAMLWSLALALFITPYVGSWDFVALLPLYFFTFKQVDWKRKLFLFLAYILAWYGMALVQHVEVSYNLYFWWVPPVLLACVAIVTSWSDFFKRPVKVS